MSRIIEKDEAKTMFYQYLRYTRDNNPVTAFNLMTDDMMRMDIDFEKSIENVFDVVEQEGYEVL